MAVQELLSNDAWHALSVDEALERQGVDSRHGLSVEEVERRLEQFGPNEVEARRGPGPLRRFLAQLNQPLVLILIVAGVVTLVIGEYIDSGVIFAVVVLNATVGFIQESRAVGALAALNRTMATRATVLRDGERLSIPAAGVVPGDIVLVQSGDKIPADLRLTRIRELQVDEAAFTGESVPAMKSVDAMEESADLADRANMAYSSTLVTYGQATGVVVATGTATEVGRISELMDSADDIATPLTRQLASFSRLLLIAILILAGLTFFVGLAHGGGLTEVFIASVAFAVAAIPEGLPAAVTVTLAIGVNRMASRRAIIRRLPAVETLGSTSVICSDKTGTLTENQMTVQAIWSGGLHYTVSGLGYHLDGEVEPETAGSAENAALERCLVAGLLCNESSLVQEDDRWQVRGDPTEGSLIVAAHKAGLFVEEQEEKFPRLDAVPFESEHQYMATLHRTSSGQQNVVFLKGAAEAILQRCDHMLSADGGTEPLDRESVHQEVEAMAANGLRVLAFAELECSSSKVEIAHGDVTVGLAFLGLQGMIDPPREEAIEAVAACQRAGIVVKMITGDHAVTAASIAQKLGIGASPSRANGELPPAMTGREFVDLSEDKLAAVVEEVHVFARVPPEGKLKLVRALQSRGHVVAMTGDGVNDGPALRQADIGIAMGVAGTEVARDASDMVLTDDNFASIEAAVEEGRGVFDNLTKFLVYILPTNLGQGLVLLFAIVLGTTLPMLPAQVLWINMTTAVLLGLTLAFEPREAGIMERPPRDPKAPLLDHAMIMRMLLISGILLAGAFGCFQWAIHQGSSVEEARTVAVNVFVVVQCFYLLNCRSMTGSLISVGIFRNRWVLIGISTMLISQLLFTYAPVMNTLFGTEGISIEYWVAIASLGVGAFVIVEFEKWIRRLHAAKQAG